MNGHHPLTHGTFSIKYTIRYRKIHLFRFAPVVASEPGKLMEWRKGMENISTSHANHRVHACVKNSLSKSPRKAFSMKRDAGNFAANFFFPLASFIYANGEI